jgi:phosphoglycerate dehydrogenase-like enzyme
MAARVLVDPHFRTMEEVFSPTDLQRLYGIAEVVWGQNGPATAEVIEACRAKTVAVVAANWRYGDVRTFPRLRAILEVSGRFPNADELDYETCFAQNIRVLSCAPSFGPIVAEMAFAMALAGARDLVTGHEAMRTGGERYYADGNTEAFTLREQPVGLIGYGNIARSLQPLLAPLHCPISVYDPWLADGFLRDQGMNPVSLETLLAQSRVIFVLAAPNESNRHLLNRERLERIPRGALLVLISRAHVVDFDALTDLLYAGRFKAAIDVFPQEPLSPDHPIRRAPNTILSAHRAGGDAAGYPFIGHMVVNDLEAILAGRLPQQMQCAQPEMIRIRGACKE